MLKSYLEKKNVTRFQVHLTSFGLSDEVQSSLISSPIVSVANGDDTEIVHVIMTLLMQCNKTDYFSVN